jgi:hypothetical protein
MSVEQSKPERGSSRGPRLSRREFARGVAAAAAAAALSTDPKARTRTGIGIEESARIQSLTPPAEAQFQAIVSKYGDRLSEEQRGEIRRLLTQAQKASEAMRSFPLENSNEPATTFHARRKKEGR